MPRRLALLALPVVLVLALAGCGSEPLPAPLRPETDPDAATVVVDRDGVEHAGVAVAAGAELAWAVPAVRNGRLRLAWSAPAATGTVRLVAEGTDGDRHVAERRFAACDSGCDVFHEDLPAPAAGRLRLFAEPAAEVVLADLRIVTPHPANDALIVLVVDTLRRDAVGLYGARRPTTPHVDRVFAEAWRAERAYAMASWTTPSVASLLTGAAPETLADATGAPLGIPAGMPTLGTDFRRAGWSTAHFDANPALGRENGFAAGFTTFYTPPREAASMAIPGDETLRRVAPWLAAHAGERFFLYVQLVEPHEPWGPPDRPRGETPFDPRYDGPFDGHESHYALTFRERPTKRDVHHLRALYDDDVRYADALFGAFWEGLGEELRRRATVVFTSDHGEEFMEHGGWKHGPALHDEVLRVPFLVRRGGSFPPIEAPGDVLASLADLRPTLLAGYGLATPDEDEGAVVGRSLLDPATWTRESLPAISMLTGGAARAVVVHRSGKLTFFDRWGERGVPDRETDPRARRLALHLRRLLPALGWYDTTADPGELRLLRPTGDRRRGWRDLERAIAHTRSGLELRLLGGDAAQTVRLHVAVAAPAAEPFAAERDDALARLDNGTWRLALRLPPGDVDGALFAADADARPVVTLESGCVRAAAGPLAPGVATPMDVAPGVPRFTVDPRCPTLHLWHATPRPRVLTDAEEDERRRRLRALGYVH